MAVYKRSIFIINPVFQYRFAFVICSLVLLVSLVYPITIYDLYEKVILLQPGNEDKLEESRMNLLYLLFILEFAFIGIVFVVSIFMSHKIAGPLYKLQNYLRDIREGGDVKSLFFRDGDHFHELAEEVSQTMEYFSKQREKDFSYLDEVSSYIANLALVVPEDKKPVLNEIQSKLSEIQTRYQND